ILGQNKEQVEDATAGIAPVESTRTMEEVSATTGRPLVAAEKSPADDGGSEYPRQQKLPSLQSTTANVETHSKESGGEGAP
ncbi:unnamed protein product, partial [Amoebophrya sp. A120]